MSRLSKWDVKWTDVHRGNKRLFQEVHSNPFYEILVVTQGPVFLQAGSEEMTLLTGETLLLFPWEHHQLWKEIEEDAGFFWVQFSCEPPLREMEVDTSVEESFWRQQSKSDLRISNSGIDEIVILPRRFKFNKLYEFLHTFEALLTSQSHPSGYFRMQMTLQLGRILELLANSLLEQQMDISSVQTSFLTYRRLVVTLDEFFSQEITKKLIEDELDRKYEYLSHIFKKYAGMTITDYIHELRIQRAKYLLQNGSLSVQDIAAEVGYKDPFHFSRIFKKIVSVSPKEYRKREELKDSMVVK